MTLVFEDGKWVEAHKMILAASSCLCLAENSKKKTSASTDLYEMNSEQYPIQWVLLIFEGLYSLHLIQILCATFYAFSSFWSSVSGGEPKACAG